MSVVSMPKDSTLVGPYQLPRGWRWCLLEDIAEVVGGVTKGQKFGPDDELVEVPYLRVANVQREHLRLEEILRITTTKQKANALRLLPGDILLNEGGDRDKLGRGWVWGGEIPDCIHQNHVFRARILNGLPPKFVSFYANSIGQAFFFEKAKQTTNLASISLSKIRQLPVPVPPHDIASEIVAQLEAHLSRLDKATADLRSVEAKLTRHRVSVLAAATSGTLVPTEAELARREGRSYEPASVLLDRILAERRARWEADQIASFRAKGKIPRDDAWQAKYQPPIAPETSGLPALPDGWTWATVEQLAADDPRSITDGPFGSNLKSEHYTETGPRVIRLQNIGDGVFVDERAHIQPKHFASLANHHVFAGDIVVAALGEVLPRACILPDDLGPALVKADCMRVKPDAKLVLASYLLKALISPQVRHRTADSVKGVGRPRINLGTVRGIPIPLPPLSEQARIVAALEQVDELRSRASEAAKSNLRRAASLRAGILQAAFQPSGAR
jgi:type I restriction enzyme S subunit